MASSRLAADGKLSTFEEPDIKAILKKCGMPSDDKPLLYVPEKKAVSGPVNTSANALRRAK